jgi:hypothetical protein
MPGDRVNSVSLRSPVDTMFSGQPVQKLQGNQRLGRAGRRFSQIVQMFEA